jgi:hypothetical protein
MFVASNANAASTSVIKARFIPEAVPANAPQSKEEEPSQDTKNNNNSVDTGNGNVQPISTVNQNNNAHASPSTKYPKNVLRVPAYLY